MKCAIVLALLVVAVSSFPQKRNCNSFCPMYIVEFCGSDGVTYNSNPCFIQSQWCSQGRNDFATFTQLHMGACTGDELLSQQTTTANPTNN